MMKKIFLFFALISCLFACSQDQTSYIDFLGNVTTTVRNTLTPASGGAVLVYNTTTSQFEYSNSVGNWQTFGGGGGGTTYFAGTGLDLTGTTFSVSYPFTSIINDQINANTAKIGITPAQSTKLSGIETGATVGANWNTNLTNIPALLDLNGSGTKVNAGTNVTVTGTGTIASPYVISSTASGGGGGDVSGPSSSTNNGIARFDGTTGKLIQNSGIIISDADANVDFNFADLINARSLTTNVSVETSYLESGDFRAIPKDVEPSSVEGSFYWDDSENRLKGYDGTSFKKFLMDGDVVGGNQNLTSVLTEGNSAGGLNITSGGDIIPINNQGKNLGSDLLQWNNLHALTLNFTNGLGNALSVTSSLSLDTFLAMEPTDVVPSIGEGRVYADNSENRPKYYDGVSWKAFLLDGDATGGSQNLASVLALGNDGGGASMTGIGTITSNGSSVLTQSNVVNNLTSTSTNTPLSANQGKILKDLIDGGVATNSPLSTILTNGNTANTLINMNNNRINNVSVLELEPTATLFADATVGSIRYSSSLNRILLKTATQDVSLRTNEQANATVVNSSTIINLSGYEQKYTASASSSASWTLTEIQPGGYAEVLINRATEPTITGATKFPNTADFIPNVNMLMVVKAFGTTVKYFFVQY